MTLHTAPSERSATEEEATWLRRLRAAGRATTARRATLQVLTGTDQHLSVAALHDRIVMSGTTADLATIYRVVDWLTCEGLAHRLDVPGEARYGRHDHDHHHAVCVGCGRVSDIEPVDIADVLDAILQATGVAPDPGAGLTVRGRCRSCRG